MARRFDYSTLYREEPLSFRGYGQPQRTVPCGETQVKPTPKRRAPVPKSYRGLSAVELKHCDLPDHYFDRENLAWGTQVEFEHTDDPAVAKCIAKAHLLERPDYYDLLEKYVEGHGMRGLERRPTGEIRRPRGMGKKPSCSPVDAQAMAKKHPKTFKVPSKAKLKKIKKGDTVKITVADERFWVTVTSVKGNKVCGKVDNETSGECKKFTYGKKVCFKKKNIYDVW